MTDVLPSVSPANQTTDTAKCAMMGSSHCMENVECRCDHFSVNAAFRETLIVRHFFCDDCLKDWISRVLLTQEVLGWLLHAQLCRNLGSRAAG